MKTIAKVILVFGLSGCSQDGNFESKTHESIVGAHCPVIDGVENLLSDGGPEVIIVGEMHGMAEPPAFVKALTCHSLSRGHKTALALEMSDSNGILEKYLTSDGGDIATKSLFEGGMWKSEFTDGRSSEAMLELVDYAREVSQTNNLSVIKFKADDLNFNLFLSKNPDTGEDDFDQNGYSAAYEKAMAVNILSGATKTGADKTIVLVGNVHARRSNVTFGELDYPAMAANMPKPRSITLNTVSIGGTSWNCRGGKPSDCKVNKTNESISRDSKIAKTGNYTILLGEGRGVIPYVNDSYYKPEWFDGVIFVGAATASPPANLAGRVPYAKVEK